MRWALAFEAYIKINEHVRGRWQYKLDQITNKYSECEILLYFENTRHVTVKIYLNTAVIIVSGTSFKVWINAEFIKVKKEFCKQDEPDKGVNTKIKLEDRCNEIDILWEKQEEIYNAVATQDECIQDFIKRCQNLEDGLAKTNYSINDIILETVKKFDNK